MNILYINHYAGSIQHGMEYRPYYLSREWVRLGHKVTVVAGGYSHIRKQNITIPDNQKYLRQNIDGIEYIWCKTPPYQQNGIKRVINIFVFLRRLKQLIPYFTGQRSLLNDQPVNKPDLVIASSTYPFDTRIAYKIARKTGAKFVYEVHDLWPLTPIELGGMSKYHPFIFMMQKAEDFAYSHADKVVSLLPKAKDYMQQHGMSADKFVYLPNGVSISDWQDSKELIPDEHQNEVNKIRARYNFLVGYAGGMGESNALDYLITAAANINRNPNNKIAFVLVGDGACKQQLIKRLKNQSVTNTFFLPAVNKAQIPDFLSKMDALYIGWHHLSIYRFGVCPNKLFDYMLSAKPVIHSITAGNDLVYEANCGITVPAEDINAITKAIEKLSKEPAANLLQLGNNGRSYVMKFHNYATLAQKFLEKCL